MNYQLSVINYEIFGNLRGPSETSGDLREPPGTFGNLRKPSETVGNLQKPSETFRNLQKPSETFGNLWFGPVRRKSSGSVRLVRLEICFRFGSARFYSGSARGRFVISRGLPWWRAGPVLYVKFCDFPI